MNIAIIGYGKMGHEIETIAKERGHSITLIIDQNNLHELTPENLINIDVAIEFTTPQTAFENVKKCLNAGKPVVCGTTGWIEKLEDARTLAEKGNGALFYASNFSIGVNLFFKLNSIFAKYVNGVDAYSVAMEEIHHTQKKDAPSGTAITLAQLITKEIETLNGWTLLPDFQDDKLPIKAIREGEVTGTHKVTYNSNQDEITLVHRAKDRKGFALGAVMAAEFSKGKTGFLTMDSLLNV